MGDEGEKDDHWGVKGKAAIILEESIFRRIGDRVIINFVEAIAFYRIGKGQSLFLELVKGDRFLF